MGEFYFKTQIKWEQSFRRVSTSMSFFFYFSYVESHGNRIKISDPVVFTHTKLGIIFLKKTQKQRQFEKYRYNNRIHENT